MTAPSISAAAPLSPGRLIRITSLAWIAIISLDFFLNAGLLSRLYRWDLPGFLPPLKMFQYIPLGYAAFLFWSILLIWLMKRLSIAGLRRGAGFGLTVGILCALAGFCGQLSIFDLPAWMLFIWAVVNTLSFTLGGAVAGAALAAPNLRRLTLRLVALFLGCLVLGILLQNIGGNPSAQRLPGRIGISLDE